MYLQLYVNYFKLGHRESVEKEFQIIIPLIEACLCLTALILYILTIDGNNSTISLNTLCFKGEYKWREGKIY